jgi:hypothetical protein
MIGSAIGKYTGAMRPGIPRALPELANGFMTRVDGSSSQKVSRIREIEDFLDGVSLF